MSAIVVAMMIITPISKNSLWRKSVMKSISNNSDGYEKTPEDIVDADELDYLLEKEKSLIAKRQYHFRRFSTSPPSNPVRTGTDLSQPILESVIKGKDSTLVSAQLASTETDNFSLPDLGQEEIGSSHVSDQNGDLYLDIDEEHNEENEESGLNDQDDSLEDDLFAFGLDHRDNALFEIDGEPAWLELAAEVEEFEADSVLEFEDVEVGGVVSREGRALQAAMELGNIFHLADDDVQAIALIFERNGWSACKEAVSRELNQGVTITEILLAAEIKEIWFEHYEFYSAQESNYRILSWPTALRLVNSFSGYPDPAEVEQLLINLHHHWKTDTIQRLITRSFNEYLIGYVDRVIGGFEYAPEWVIEQETSRQEDPLLPPSSTDIPCNHDFELERSLRAIRLSSMSLNCGGYS